MLLEDLVEAAHILLKKSSDVAVMTHVREGDSSFVPADYVRQYLKNPIVMNYCTLFKQIDHNSPKVGRGQHFCLPSCSFVNPKAGTVLTRFVVTYLAPDQLLSCTLRGTPSTNGRRQLWRGVFPCELPRRIPFSAAITDTRSGFVFCVSLPPKQVTSIGVLYSECVFLCWN